MPAYDFRCKECHHTFTITTSSINEMDTLQPVCLACNSANLSRLINRVAVLTSEEQRIDRLSDPSILSELNPDDPRSMGKLMRKMSEEAGEPLDAELGEVVERLEKGESPESIEKSMDIPDLPE